MLNFIIGNILRNPPVLLALIAILGLVLQKKSFSEIVKGAFLTAFGMIILDAGVGLLIGTISPINTAFMQFTGGEVGKGLNDVTFTAKFGADVGLAMFVGLIIHILIARFTKIKIIFLTGHMLWWFPFIFVAASFEAGLKGTSMIIVSGVASALYWSFMPYALKKYVKAVTKDDSFTLGHPTGFLSLIAGFIASKVGNKNVSTEDIKFPKSLDFLREISVTGAIAVLIIWFFVGLMVPNLIAKDSNLFFAPLKQGLTFGAGLLVMLQGVRLLIGQIVPAFKGISEKLVPDAIPAFDCPVIFSYKPNAVIVGFVVAMIVSTITIVIFNTSNLFGVLLLPLVITSFFECGAAAVIAEAQGGLKGCVIGTVVASIFMVVFLGLSMHAYQKTISNWMLIFGGNDFSLFGTILKFIAELLSGIL